VELAALILAAGAGTRLRPLTYVRPKALCPVNNEPLIDIAIGIVEKHTRAIAVNVHHGREQMEEHLTDRVHLSFEEERALGSAGAVGALRDWLGGRNLLIANADRYHADDLRSLLDGWNGESARLLVVEDPERGDFGTKRFAGASLLPWAEASRLDPEPAALKEACWEPMRHQELLELVESDASFVDCGTPAEYHHANMLAAAGHNVVAPGVRVDGEIERCVLWPGTHVGAKERLVDAIRASDDVTVFVS
jgi:MurNAc alpha-1-phosphate uridylyltransferase